MLYLGKYCFFWKFKAQDWKLHHCFYWYSKLQYFELDYYKWRIIMIIVFAILNCLECKHLKLSVASRSMLYPGKCTFSWKFKMHSWKLHHCFHCYSKSQYFELDNYEWSIIMITIIIIWNCANKQAFKTVRCFAQASLF